MASYNDLHLDWEILLDSMKMSKNIKNGKSTKTIGNYNFIFRKMQVTYIEISIIPCSINHVKVLKTSHVTSFKLV